MRTPIVAALCIAAGASAALLVSRTQPDAGRSDVWSAAAKDTSSLVVRRVSPFGDGPARYEPNRGQAGEDVRWLRRGPRDMTLVGDDGFSMVAASSISLPGAGAAPLALEAVRMRFDGGASAPRSAGEDVLAGVTHYFVGSDPSKWLRGVPNYARVRLDAVWPGIDVVFHGRDGRAEYDFVLAPGADPGAIALAVEGASAVRVDEGGDLVIEAGELEFRHHRPRVWQEGAGAQGAIGCAFALDAEGRVRFRVTGADARLPLVIDPIITSARRFGGDASDFPATVAITQEDIAVVGGTTLSAILGAGPLAGSRLGSSDAFIGQFGPGPAATGNLAILGGAQNDGITDLHVARDGNLIGSGYTTDSGTLPTSGGTAFSNLGGVDSFLLSMTDSVDLLQWLFPLGGGGSDVVTSIALQHTTPTSSSLAAVLAGMHTSSQQLDGFAAFGSTGQRAVVYRFDAAGVRTGQRLISSATGVYQQVPVRLASDEQSGTLFVGVSGARTAFSPTPGALLTTTNAFLPGYVESLRLDLSSVNAGTFVPGTQESVINGMAFIPGVGVALTGFYSSGTVTTTPNAAYPGAASAINIRSHFTTISPDLAQLLTQGNLHESGSTLTASAHHVPGTQEVIVLGVSNGLTPVGPGGPFHGTLGTGASDAVYLRLPGAGGAPTAVGYVGGTGGEALYPGFPSGLQMEYGCFGAVGNHGELVVIGQTQGTFADWPELAGGVSGSRDAFVQGVPLGGSTDGSYGLDVGKLTLNLARNPDATAKVSFKLTLLDPDGSIDAGLGGAGTFGLRFEMPTSTTAVDEVVSVEVPLAGGKLTSGGEVETLRGSSGTVRWSVKIDDRRDLGTIVSGTVTGLPAFDRTLSSPVVGYPLHLTVDLNGTSGNGWVFAPPTSGFSLKFDEPKDVDGEIESTPPKIRYGLQNSVTAFIENPLDRDRFVQVEIFHKNFKLLDWQGTVESRDEITGLPGLFQTGVQVATPGTGPQPWFLRIEGSHTDSTKTITFR